MQLNNNTDQYALNSVDPENDLTPTLSASNLLTDIFASENSPISKFVTAQGVLEVIDESLSYLDNRNTFINALQNHPSY